MGQEIGRRDTPRAIGCFGSFRNVLPDLGSVFNDAEANNDKGPHEQPELAAREDLVDLRHRRTHGRLFGARGGVSPAVSPLTWRTSALLMAS